MRPGDLQAISAACTIVSTIVALLATVICLKISQQISQLEARILSRLAEQYVSKDDLRLVLDKPQHEGRSAAHA